MPYSRNYLDDAERERQFYAAQPVSGASSVADGDGSGEGGEPLNTGSNFQNLDKYLNPAQAQQFGDQFMSHSDGELASAREGQQQGADQFRSRVTGANQLPTTQQVGTAIGRPGQADADQFRTWRTDSYKGPKALTDTPDLFSKYWKGTEKANTTASLLDNPSGRFTLLDSYFGRPNYSFGQKSLDNSILQHSGIDQRVRDFQDSATQLKRQGSERANHELRDFATQRSGEVDASKRYVRGEIGIDDQDQVTPTGAVGRARASAERRRQGQEWERLNALNRKVHSLKHDQNLSDIPGVHDRAIYGTTPELSSYLTPSEPLTLNHTLTAPQRARIQALSKLAGIEDNFSGTHEAKPPLYSFNTPQFLRDQEESKGNYDRAFGENQKEIWDNSEGIIHPVVPEWLNKNVTEARDRTFKKLQEIYQNYGMDEHGKPKRRIT